MPVEQPRRYGLITEEWKNGDVTVRLQPDEQIRVPSKKVFRASENAGRLVQIGLGRKGDTRVVRFADVRPRTGRRTQRYHL
jgi:hypothetical protein